MQIFLNLKNIKDTTCAQKLQFDIAFKPKKISICKNRKKHYMMTLF